MRTRVSAKRVAAIGIGVAVISAGIPLAVALGPSGGSAPPMVLGQQPPPGAPPAPPQPPPNSAPPWVGANGMVDVSKMPREAPILGFDGNELRDAQGNLVMIPLKALTEDPEDPAAQAALAAAEKLRTADAQRKGIRVPAAPSPAP